MTDGSVKIDVIAAARPNFMKVAPLLRVLRGAQDWCQVRLVHTGQHYDVNMSDAFFLDLGIPEPDLHLGVGSGTHAEQTARVMIEYERACQRARPDWTIVVGDVNSTMACALAATKLGIRVAHLEAGLRSRDRTMPEEINRIVTDAVADLLWTPSPDADDNLRDEGIPASRIVCVGNVMIDSLEMMRSRIEARGYIATQGLVRHGYGVVTVHRPSNVDDLGKLAKIVDALVTTAARMPIVFPVHPRTRQRLDASGLSTRLRTATGIRLLDPLGYIDFMSAVFDCAFVITDSGGIQEETTYLGIPCLTLRDSTERPITVTHGTNRLLCAEDLAAALGQILSGDWPKGSIPEGWDGRAAEKAVASLRTVCAGSANARRASLVKANPLPRIQSADPAR